MQALRNEGLPDFDRGKGWDRSKGPKDSCGESVVILENAFGTALNMEIGRFLFHAKTAKGSAKHATPSASSTLSDLSVIRFAHFA
jgi:hypothetical protein